MKHIGPIAGISAHGQYIATAGYDNRLILWDKKTHLAIARATHDHLVNHCEFSHDGTRLVSASSDYSARVWSVPDMRLLCVLSGHTDDVDMATFSPDDTLIATCALDRTVRVFDLRGECCRIFTGHTGNIISVAWSHDGQRLISSSVDGTIREWCMVQGRELYCNQIHFRTDTLSIDTQGRIFAGDDAGRLLVIIRHEIRPFPAHDAGIKKVILDESHATLISLSYDGSLAIWRITPEGDLQVMGRSRYPASVWARAAVMISDDFLAVGTFGSRYGLYSVAENRWYMEGITPDPSLNAITRFAHHTYTVGDAGTVFCDNQPVMALGSLCNFLLPTAHRLFAGGQRGALFDALTGEVCYQHHSPLNCGTPFLRHGEPYIAIGTYTGELLIFSLAPELELVMALPVFANAIKGVTATDDRLFSVCASRKIAWHTLADFQLVRAGEEAHEKIINGCCVAGEQQFATISRDRTLKLWSDNHVDTYLSPHPNSIKCIAVDDKRMLLATGAYTGTVAVLDLRHRRWCYFHRLTVAGISSLVYDPDSQAFLAASYDGCVYRIARCDLTDSHVECPGWQSVHIV